MKLYSPYKMVTEQNEWRTQNTKRTVENLYCQPTFIYLAHIGFTIGNLQLEDTVSPCA